MIWKIENRGSEKIYKSEECELKVLEKGEEKEIYLNRKGYNPIMVMEVWGFGEETKERNINYILCGEGSDGKTWSYKVKNKDFRLFIDMIYFFLKEHDIDGVLNEI